MKVAPTIRGEGGRLESLVEISVEIFAWTLCVEQGASGKVEELEHQRFVTDSARRACMARRHFEGNYKLGASGPCREKGAYLRQKS